MNKFTAAFSFALMIMAFAPAFAEDEVANGDGPYPVWLSPYSPVKSLDDVEEAWTRPFLHGEEDRESRYHKWEFTKGEGAAEKTVFAEDCATIFKLE
jgi:hypothetical protein